MKLFQKKYHEYSDEMLISFMKNGDKKAFDEIYLRYSKVMLLFFRRLLWNDLEKAQDFVHDLFAKLITNPDLFDEQRNFKTWFYTIANNMCKNEYKKQEVRKNSKNSIDDSYGIKDDSQNVFNIVHENSFIEQFEIQLEELDEKHKNVFVLRHFDGLSIKEIAEILEINEGTIKSRLFYATKYLANKLQHFQPSYNH